MTRFTQLSLVAGLSIGLLSTSAWAQFRQPEDAVAYRKGALNVMGNHFFVRLGGMVSGRAPYDAKAAQESADVVLFMSKLPWAGFGPGTNVGDTAAKPAIWTEQAKFRELAEAMQGDAQKLANAAKAGNLETLRGAFRVLGESCKKCHDEYRKM